MARTGYADPVVNFSVSCDPQLLKRLNDYASKKRTTRSWIVRKALLQWLEEHDPKDIEAWTCMRCFGEVALDEDACTNGDCSYVACGPHLDAINRWRARG
tara:strand:- start:81 stop:380 length:300 start_codon:yes stop_codon:yes gene_type:complete